MRKNICTLLFVIIGISLYAHGIEGTTLAQPKNKSQEALLIYPNLGNLVNYWDPYGIDPINIRIELRIWAYGKYVRLDEVTFLFTDSPQYILYYLWDYYRYDPVDVNLIFNSKSIDPDTPRSFKEIGLDPWHNTIVVLYKRKS